MSPLLRLPLITALLLFLAAPASCDFMKGIEMSRKRPYQYETPVARRLEEFSRTGPHGAQRRMDEFTDFAWNTVHLFGEGDKYRDIDAMVGTTVFGRDGRYMEQGSLLIFTTEGRVVHAVALVPPIIDGRAQSHSREAAMLRAITKDPGPYHLEFD